ncbi:hypothetical protein EDD11_007425 [Mortierella claussenii]|nr:hypothetical protein EDD11_007425 [Mortierella claussenii]
MISISSTPKVLHPTLGIVSTSVSVSSAPSDKDSSHSSATSSSPGSDALHPSTNSSINNHNSAVEMSTRTTSANTSASVECKRPTHYHVHSHSSRHVNLTDEITPRDMALSIIQAQYHIYHTDLSGYLAGGAMVQDALTKYALGATPKDLFQTYKRFRQDKERIPPAPTITITTRNWRDWLGHKSYYHDYLDFFDHELRQLETRMLKEPSSSVTTSFISPSVPIPLSALYSTSSISSPLQESMVEMVSEYLTPLIPGLCAAMGPLIHLGYGIEFGSRLVTAEGLAYACISYQPATVCFIPSTASGAASWSSSASAGPPPSLNPQEKSPTVRILNMIRNDKRLDGMFDAGFQGKLNVVMSSRVSLLKSYLGMWTDQVHSIQEALLDLSQTSSLLLFTATNRFGDEQQLDKNLANIMLAAHAARFLVKLLSTDVQQENLLKAIWMSLVATFVVQGRPILETHSNTVTSTLPVMVDVCLEDKDHEQKQQELEKQQQELADSERDECRDTHKAGMAMSDGKLMTKRVLNIPIGRWRALSTEAIHADHPIVPKIVRSLWWAELAHGKCGDLFYDAAVRAVGEDPASDESSGPGF